MFSVVDVEMSGRQSRLVSCSRLSLRAREFIVPEMQFNDGWYSAHSQHVYTDIDMLFLQFIH